MSLMMRIFSPFRSFWAQLQRWGCNNRQVVKMALAMGIVGGLGMMTSTPAQNRMIRDTDRAHSMSERASVVREMWVARPDLPPESALLLDTDSEGSADSDQDWATMAASDATSAEAKSDALGAGGSQTEKVVASWDGMVEWKTATQGRVHITLKIPKGWKIYGPADPDDAIQRPTQCVLSDKSHNVASIQPIWPSPQLFQDQNIKAHVYYQELRVPVDVFLEGRGPAHLAVEVQGLSCAKLCKPFTVTLATDITPPVVGVGEWVRMLILAFLGGLILNGMPCVLPVLGLKLKGFVAADRRQFRLGCAMTVGGIFIGFWVLALAIIVAKTVFGQAVSWGMQLQNPYFAGTLALFMVMASYGLLGVFHVQTPSWAVQAADAASRSHSRLWQSFVSGLLGVVLATPCSAPFLGSSIGFALAGSGLEIVLFYSAIASGFGLPYLLGIILPVDRFLPKPGAWMIVLERVMGWLFLASAAWLILWPMSAFMSPRVYTIAIGCVAAYALIPILHQMSGWVRRTRWVRILTLYVLPLGMGLGLLGVPMMGGRQQTISMKDGAIVWQPFDKKVIAQALRQGKSIFVDVTGVGCALCIVNKRVFRKDEVQNRLLASDVVCMRADYSYGDKDILAFLKRHGRAAIPFNVLITPHMPQGIVLSEMLSVDDILSAFSVADQVRMRHSGKTQPAP